MCLKMIRNLVTIQQIKNIYSKNHLMYINKRSIRLKTSNKIKSKIKHTFIFHELPGND